MCNNTQKKKAAGAGKDFTLFFGVILHFNFKCANKWLPLHWAFYGGIRPYKTTTVAASPEK